jgi:hypothetical protein
MSVEECPHESPAPSAVLRRLAYLSSPPLLVCAACVSGLLEALTPLSIITGAIMLFQAMHHTKVRAGVGAARRGCCTWG